MSLSAEIFRRWLSYSSERRVIRERLNAFTRLRKQLILLRSFKELYLCAHIGDENMQEVFNRLKTRRHAKQLKVTVKAWLQIARKLHRLNQQKSKIQSKKNNKSLTAAFADWKDKAYWQHFSREVLLPFQATRVQKFKAKGFHSLRLNIALLRLKQQRVQEAEAFYCKVRLS